MKSKILLAGMAALATASVLSTTAPAAFADPDTTPRTYNGVGSDTIQNVSNDLFNTGGPFAGKDVASWDAFGSGCIQPSSTGPVLRRPQGSGDGTNALSAAWHRNSAGGPTATWQGCTAGSPDPNVLVELDPQDVAFSRSSSRPGAAGSDLTYVPFARDAVSVALRPSGSLTTLDLNTAQLKELYSGVNNTDDDNGTTTVTISGSGASAVATINGVTVHPQVPQQGSGTRSFFLGAIGVTTLAAYISDPALPAGHHENDGREVTNPGDLIPFSAAQWISQVNHGGSGDTTTGLVLAKINSNEPYTGSGSTLKPGPLFGAKNINGDFTTVPSSGFGNFNRDTYYVVPTDATIAAYNGQRSVSSESTLVSLIENDLYSTSGKSTITADGFGVLAYYKDSSKYIGGAFTK